MIPKIIWSYWDSPEFNFPKNITQILDNTRKKIDYNWKLIILNNLNIFEYLNKDQFPKNYYKLTAKTKSDWIRLKLIEQYGGLWLDASIIINNFDKIEAIYSEATKLKPEFTGFYADQCLIKNDPQSYIETWFILAKKNNFLIKAWLLELEKAIDLEDEYPIEQAKKGYHHPCILRFIKEGFDIRIAYVQIYLTLQIVLKNLNKKPSILLYNASETMFKLHVDNNWKSEKIKNNLENPSNFIKQIPFIKLRENDRILDLSKYFNII